MTVLIYVVFDLSVLHWLSAWLTALFELLELAPIIIGVWFFWTTRAGRDGRVIGIPKILHVPVMSTMILLQILLMAGIYRCVGFT